MYGQFNADCRLFYYKPGYLSGRAVY
jgi:hypothetical protein